MTVRTPTPDVETVSTAIYAQVMSVMGLHHPGFATRCLGLIFSYPVNFLSKILVEVDEDIIKEGWSAAIKRQIDRYVGEVELVGATTIPPDGPLLVYSNHPAALDFVIISAAMRRDDVKIVASDVPIVQLLSNISEHFIPVSYNIPARLETVRATIRHLKNDGAILIFPRGNIEPDPAVSPGAERYMARWSPSIELFLRQVPHAQVVATIATGMLSEKWYKNPLIQLWKKYEQRQKVAEVFQIAFQVITRRKPRLNPKITFSEPMSIADLGGLEAPEGCLLKNMVARCKVLLRQDPHNYT